MNPKEALAYLGAALLFIGTFCPIIQTPDLLGTGGVTYTYFQYFPNAGPILLGVSIASALLTAIKHPNWLWLPTGFGVILLTITLHNATRRADYAITPLGWIIMISGVVCIVVVAAMRRPKEITSPTE
jgi:hypothetical protein